MNKNEFIHRAIIAQMATPYSWGSDNNPFRRSFSDIIEEARDMADYVEQEGIPFDALPGRRGDGLFVAVDVGADEDNNAPEEPQDPRPDTDEERLEALKAKRDELLKSMRDTLDRNHVTDPLHLMGDALNAYINDNFEVKYIRDQMDAIYKKNPDHK